MSDHAEKKKEDKPAEGEHGEAKKKGGIVALLTKLPVLLGGAMVIEAAVMLVAFKMLAGGPTAAKADVDLHAESKTEAHGDAEADGHGDAAAKEGAHGEAKKPEDPHAKPAADAHAETAKEDAHGGGGHGEAAAPAAPAIDPKKMVEVMVVEFRAPNKMGGRTFLYDLSIFAVTKGKNKTQLEAAIKDRGALIKDRIRTIIAQSDPDKLGGGAEPGLETLRRQVRYQLEQIVGEGIVDEVLVPRCIPFRTDF